MFRIIVGFIFCLGAVFIGLYVGLYLCLFGGIKQAGGEVVQLISNFDKNVENDAPVSVGDFALGVMRIVAAGLCGWISFMVGLSVGVGFVASGLDSKGWL